MVFLKKILFLEVEIMMVKDKTNTVDLHEQVKGNVTSSFKLRGNRSKLKLQISRLLRGRSSLTFRQL